MHATGRLDKRELRMSDESWTWNIWGHSYLSLSLWTKLFCVEWWNINLQLPIFYSMVGTGWQGEEAKSNKSIEEQYFRTSIWWVVLTSSILRYCVGLQILKVKLIEIDCACASSEALPWPPILRLRAAHLLLTGFNWGHSYVFSLFGWNFWTSFFVGNIFWICWWPQFVDHFQGYSLDLVCWLLV